MCRSPLTSSTRLSLTRGPPHRDRTGRRGHLPLGVMTVADHQPTAIGVDLPSMGLDMGGDLGLQRGRQHLPGTITDNLIQQRRAGLVGLRTSWTTVSMRAYLSEPARQRRLLIENHRLQIILGKVRSFTSPGREPSTSSDHCSQGTPEDATADNAVEAEGGQRREDLVEVDLAAAYLHVLAHPDGGRTCLGHSVGETVSSQAVGAVCGVRFPVNSTEGSTNGDPNRMDVPGCR